MPLDTIELYADTIDIYDHMCRDRDSEMAFYERFKGDARTLLEIGSGTGVLSEQFARMGYRVTGIDNCPDAVELARARFPDISFHQADARNFNLLKTFDVLVVPCNTLLHMSTRDDVIMVLSAMRRHCKPGGKVVFDVRNVSSDAHELTYADEPAPPFIDQRTQDTYRIVRTIKIDPDAMQLNMFWNVFDQDLSRIVRRYNFRLSLYSQASMQECAEHAGLEVEACLGSYDGTAFEPDAHNQIFICRPKAL